MPVFPFHYSGDEHEYYFYRVPKILFHHPTFENLSTDAKLLYGLLLDRMELSKKNNWQDEKGRIYVYFTIGNICQELRCGNKKAGKLLAELDDKDGIGLITRIHQGLGKPDRIFVHKIVGRELSDMSYEHLQRCQNDTSGDVIITGAEMSKERTNDTEMKDTYIKDTNLIYQGMDGSEKALPYHSYREYFREKLDLDILIHDHPYDKESIEEILEILVETVCTGKDTVRICGEDKPAEVVKSRLMKLDMGHIDYVLRCMRENTTDVRNIKQYMLAALYNAPITISNYYTAKVNYDMARGF